MSFGAPKAYSQQDVRLNGIALGTSSYGGAVPLIYGQCRVPLMLLWYGNFIASSHIQHTGKGGGSSQNATFSYSASCALAFGSGPITSIGQVWQDKEILSLSDIGVGAGGSTYLSYGGAAPPIWPYLTANFPTQAVPYDHIAYLGTVSLSLGSSAAIPNFTFEVTGFLPFNNSISDAEPSAILIDYCTDPNHGAFFPYLDAGIQGSNSFQSYCISMGFFLSVFEDHQRDAASFIKEMTKITNSEAFVSGGVVKITPYTEVAVSGNGASYTPDLTPEYAFTDDDFLPGSGSHSADPVVCKRTPMAMTYNVVRIQYTDRSMYYNTNIVEAKDENDIELYGERVMATMTFNSIKTASIARQVAQLILQRQLYLRNHYTFSVRPDYCLLEPMSMVEITDENLGLSAKLVRILEIQIDETDKVTITAEEVLVGASGAPVYNWQLAQGYAANYAEVPPSVTAPLIFVLPPLLVGPNGGFELAVAVDGASSGTWGGADIYMSLDDVTYEYAGSTSGAARYGTLTAALAATADPDTTDTLSIALTNAASTALQLQSGSAADYQNLRTLLFVDGEIMAYETATLTSAGNYNLTNLRRGQYGSAVASHASASSFARIDSLLFRVPFDVGMMGQTVYFKCCSFNIYGKQHQSLADATAYSHVLQSTNAGALQPGPNLFGVGVTISGDSVFKSATTVGWDSSCYTQQGYSVGCSAECYPSGAVLDCMFGLTVNPNASNGYANLAFAWYTQSGVLSIYENGLSKGTYGSGYTASTHLQITYDGRFVTYWIDGVSQRQVPLVGATFFFQACFRDPGAGFSTIAFGSLGASTPTLFVARGNVLVSDSTAEKAGGIAAWDSDFYSINGYSSCNVVFKANQTSDYLMIGLIETPNPNWAVNGYLALEYAFYCLAGGTWEVYESGAYGGASGSYTTATRFAITYDGSTITYLIDGASVRTVAIAGKTFYLDSSFDTPGGGVNSLDWGPGSTLPLIDTSGIGLNAASTVASAVSSGTTGYSLSSAVNSNTVSVATTTFGNPMGVDISCDVLADLNGATFNSPMTISITRDGTVIGTSMFDLYKFLTSTPGYGSPVIGWDTHVTLTVNDAPAAGSHTYALNVNAAAASITGSSAGISITNAAIKVREYKR